MKKKNIFWGLAFIILSLTILGNITGIFGDYSPIRLVWTGFLIAFAIKNLFDLSFAGVIFPLVIAFHINAVEVFNYTGKIFPIYLAGLFLSIGLSILFSKRRKFIKVRYSGKDYKNDSFSSSKTHTSNNRVWIENNFGDASRYIHSDNLTFASIECNFGNLRVYFDQAQLSMDGVDIEVECNFGKTTLYLPRDINLQNNLTSSLGSVRGEGSFVHNPENPTVFLNGEANFGDIEIILI